MKFTTVKSKILFVAILIGFILSLNFFQKGTKGFFYNLSAPIQTTFWQLGERVSGFFGTIGNLNNLKKINDESQKTIQELLAEKASFAELKKENEILREALQIGLQKDFRLALVRVIGKDIGQESILINQGAGDGLSAGMPVVTQQKILVGRISEVFKSFSRVTLISSKESTFDAKVLASPGEAGGSDTDTTGVARGQGNSKIKFDLVPQDKTLKVGDLVVSSSLGGIYPGGLLAGTVIEVSRNDVSPFYQAEIKPLFDIQNSSAVFVILNFTK
ncbi:MAG: rod shape-determining protein MreC [Patescibacteria group bacterium]